MGPLSSLHEKETLENDTPIESSAHKEMMKEKKSFNLPPVSPFTSGEGLPYAPEGWPNPGDIWSWRVVRRTDKNGYFYDCDRFLYVPRSLQKTNRKEWFQSKPDVIRYLERNFPNMEIESFLALFSWKVPSTKGKESPEIGKAATKEIGVQRKLKRKARQCNRYFRKSSSPANNIVIDLCTLDEEAEIVSSTDLKGTSDLELDSGNQSENSSDADFNFSDSESEIHSSTGGGQPENSSVVSNFSEEAPNMMTTTEISPNAAIAENVDDYLDTLEEILVPPHTEISLSDPVIRDASLENEMNECRNKLSSFLAMDFPSLLSCNNLAEVATLASQLRKDPSLSIDQLVKLKLVEEIPLVSEAFLEAQGNIEEAEKFLAELEAKKLKATSLKTEYYALKEKVVQIDADFDRSSLGIKEIDNQILQLKSKRSAMSIAIETLKKRKVELSSSQAMVANSIPAIISEIKLGHSEQPKWDLKKAISAKRVAEIHERFITLRGLTF